MIRLLPHLAELKVWDNSAPGDPKTGARLAPILILAMKDGKIIGGCSRKAVPVWAKSIVAAAMQLDAAAMAS